MPAYNEEDSVAKVVLEWLPVFRQTEPDFTLCILNDGSRDGTLQVLQSLAAQHPEIEVVDKPNSGHGQTCLAGYKRALAQGAQWIFQIDADGQCDPSRFPLLWEMRLQHPVVYGFRFPREDGIIRFIISRIVSVATLLGMGVWVLDPGSPYRLMRHDTLKDAVEVIPDDFYLVNIVLAALQQKKYGIRWIKTRFRQRYGGASNINGFGFCRQGWRLFNQLRALHRQLKHLA